jgi:inner membrane protein
MDIVSHGLTGLLLARAGTAAPRRPVATAMVVGALSPDLDALAKLWDPLASITVHRVATHSLVGSLALALVSAGLGRAVGEDRFRCFAVLAYVGVMSHLVLDAFTPFGTVLLWPIDSWRWSVGSLHVIDPVVAVILVVGLIPWHRRRGLPSTSVPRALSSCSAATFSSLSRCATR